LRVDARSGFAYPAISAAIEGLAECAPETGIAAASVTNSHHFGIGGYHAERLADRGLVGLVFGNSPKAVAPWAGRGALYGTNPIAFAAPREHQPALVIDLSLSVAARGKIMVAAARGEPIPEGWALDPEGNPTTDAALGSKGTMLPLGGYKGYGLALMFSFLTAALSGNGFDAEQPDWLDADHTFALPLLAIAIDPGRCLGGDYQAAVDDAVCQVKASRLAPGFDEIRIPGEGAHRRYAAALESGVAIKEAVFGDLNRIAAEVDATPLAAS
ncbi:MAG: Ldh family oxidoreductase, partial [Nitrospinota bacterium]|nr:Ldh family oxidoreductase [Nitrospinota bacterium]